MSTVSSGSAVAFHSMSRGNLCSCPETLPGSTTSMSEIVAFATGIKNPPTINVAATNTKTDVLTFFKRERERERGTLAH